MRLSSYLSYQRRKLSGTIISNSKKKTDKLLQSDLPQSIQKEENDFYLSEIPVLQQTSKKMKTDLSDDQMVENIICDKSSTTVEVHCFDPAGCSSQIDEICGIVL